MSKEKSKETGYADVELVTLSEIEDARNVMFLRRVYQIH